MEAWKDELYHHGILGMKWGVSNGPPYPLDSKDHSASEKKAGWRKSLSGDSPEAKRKKTLAKARKAKQKKAKEKVREEKRLARAEKRKQKKIEKFNRERERKLNDPAWVKRHIEQLSDEELTKAKNRMNLEADTRSAVLRKMNAGKDYVDLAIGYANTGINAYNTVAKVYNATETGKQSPMTIIGEGGKKKKK